MGRLRRPQVHGELSRCGRSPGLRSGLRLVHTLARLACLLAPSVGLGACRPADGVNAAPTLVHDHHDGFWWMQTGEQSAAVASFGPTIETPEGRFRQWSLIIHLPGSTEPLSCTQGLVPLAESHPILAQGETFLVELRPCDGCLWADVTGETRLAANTQGLY